MPHPQVSYIPDTVGELAEASRKVEILQMQFDSAEI